MARLPPEVGPLLVGLLAILGAFFRGIGGCYRMLCKVLGLEPKRKVWGEWSAWAELCFNVLFFGVLLALAYGARAGSGALYDGFVALSILGIAVYLVIIAMSAYDSLSGNERRRLDEILERHEAERAALIRAMGQPEYWGSASRTASDSERPTLLASLRAEGFHPGEVMTLANVLARKAVEKELRSHGISPAHVERAHVTAATRALFAVRADALIAEAKAQLID